MQVTQVRLAAALAVAALAAVLGACGGGGGGGGEAVNTAPSKAPALPDKPVTLNILDVAGNLQLTQKAIDRYKSEHSDAVSRITYTTATAPELAGKVKAQQQAKRLDIDLVLTGTDGLSAGIAQGLWLKLLPSLDSKFQSLQQN